MANSGGLLTVAQASATPASPGTGFDRFYAKTDDLPYFQKSDGTEVAITTGVSADPLTTKGDLWGFSTVNTRVPVGSNNALLIADSSQALGLRWGNNPTLTGATIDNSVIGGSTPVAGTFTALTGTSVTSTGLVQATLITEQLRLRYDALNYASFTVSSGGDLTLAPSGGDTTITGTLTVSTTLSAASYAATGTAGAGYVQLLNQASAPGTPTTAIRLFSDASNRLSWIGTNTYTRTFDGTANTANRIYVLPDQAGTILLATYTGAVASTGTHTITGSADATQLTVIGNAAQTTTTLVVQNSSLSTVFGVSNLGFIGQGGAPQATRIIDHNSVSLTDPSVNVSGLRSGFTVTFTASTSTIVITAVGGGPTINIGATAYTTSNGIRGMSGTPTVTGSAGGTATSMIAGFYQNTITGGITLTNSYGSLVLNPTVTASTLTNNIGYASGLLSNGTNNTYVLLGTTTAASGNFAIDANSSTYASRLGAALTITGSADTTQLVVKGNSAQTSTTFEVQTSGGATLFSMSNAGAGIATTFASNRTVATTSTDGLISSNAAAASSGTTVRYSPRLRWRGHAWDTAASQTVDFWAEVQPVSAATPSGSLIFSYSLNGAAASTVMTLSSAGAFGVTTATITGAADTTQLVVKDFSTQTSVSQSWQSSGGTTRFQIGPSTVASAAGAFARTLYGAAQTITITGSTNITTATGFNFAEFGTPTYSAASALTITNAATLYIAAAPTGAGAGPATITNAYALWIDSGTTRLDGLAIFGTGINNDGGGVKHARVSTGSIAAASTSLITITWTTAFADANYTVVAQVLDSTTTSLSLSVVHIESISASAITVRVINNSATTAITGTLHIIAVHD